MKKRRYFLPLAVGILTVAVTGGVIFAQNSNSQEIINSQESLTRQLAPSTNGFSSEIGYLDEVGPAAVNLAHSDAHVQTILSRVAWKVGVTEDELQAAFDEAIREKQDETLAYRLDHMLENGRLTQVQVDDILDWFIGRPYAATKLNRALLKGEGAVKYRLRHLVKRGVIDEAEAEATLEWYGAMPDPLEELLKHRRNRSHDGRSQGQVRPSERFQGQDMDRPAAEGRPFDREGFQGRDTDRPAFRGQRFDREGFQGRDTDRPDFRGQRFDREGFQGRDGNRPDFRGQPFDREGFGPPQVPGNVMTPRARGLDHPGMPNYANQP